MSDNTTANANDTAVFTANGEYAGDVSNADFKLLYESERSESQRLRDVLAATRAATPAPDPSALKPKITAERAKALAGPTEFLKMTRDKKILAVGGDPSTITDTGLLRLFGRKADLQLAGDLAKSNPGKYALLKQCALILDLYGAEPL